MPLDESLMQPLDSYVFNPILLLSPSFGTTCSVSLQGLQQHIEASHDLFDFGYPQAEPGGLPTVEVRCPDDLYDQQGKLQTLETDDLHDDHGKVRSLSSPGVACWLRPAAAVIVESSFWA